jgi:hypothetical protein
VLGFDELLAYLQARCDAGHSVPQLAAELGLSDWQVGAALARLAVRLAPRPQRLAAQRRRYTEERIAARVPWGADDPQGPNRPGAGGFARRPPGRGSWGLSFSSSGHPHRAPILRICLPRGAA